MAADETMMFAAPAPEQQTKLEPADRGVNWFWLGLLMGSVGVGVAWVAQSRGVKGGR